MKDLMAWGAMKIVSVLAVIIVITLFFHFSNEVAPIRHDYQEAVKISTDILKLEDKYRDNGCDLIVSQIENHEKERPSRIWHPIDFYKWKKERDLLQKGAEACHEIQKEIDGLAGEMGKLRSSSGAFLHRLTTTFKNHMLAIGIIVLLTFFSRSIYNMFWYYVLASAFTASRPKALLKGFDRNISEMVVNESSQACEYGVMPGSKLLARQDWIQQHTPALRKRTRLLWKNTAVLISLSAKLTELTEFSSDSTDCAGLVRLGNGRDADVYLTRIDIANHQGLCLRPYHVVALTDGIDVKTVWRLKDPHSWIAGRLRYILFFGTGSIILLGYGKTQSQSAERKIQAQENSVIGFEGNLEIGVTRTETFWPFFRGKTALYDHTFLGDGNVLMQDVNRVLGHASSNRFMGVVDSVLYVIGKVLGV